MHQVELDILAPADLLPLLLLLGEGHVLALVDDGDVVGRKRLECVLDEGKRVLLVGHGLVQIVKEDAADAARLAPVLVVEVLIAPLLEARVVLLVMGVAHLLQRLVELDGVLVKEVAGRQVAAAAEPPRARGAVGVGRLEVSVVEVDRRGHGVLGVDDQTETGGEELEAVGDVVVLGQVLVVGAHLDDGGLGQSAVDDAHTNTGLLKHLAVLEDAGDAASTFLALPLVHPEWCAIGLF